jgi:cytochrome c-type protein NapC
VPHEWTHKIARKMQASKEVWGKVFGSIDTPEKFQAKRLELAQHEWARLKANDSLECRNCHNYESMDFTRQSVRAQNMHTTYLASREKTCIDCHKGIAHKLPHIPPGEAPTDTPGQVLPADTPLAPVSVVGPAVGATVGAASAALR